MERYASQQRIIGKGTQEKLEKNKITIVGVGALGSVSSEQLTRAGIGELVLVDHDIVEVSNLQRQTLYTEKDVGLTKADAAKKRLDEINSNVRVASQPKHLNKESVDLLDADMVLDCTDNLETRFLINDYCSHKKIPWVYCAAAGSKGAVLTFNGTFCFSCVFEGAKEALTCEEEGILNSAAAIASSLQVTEVVKLLMDSNYEGKLIHFDILKNEFETLRVKKNPNCKTCNKTQKIAKKTYEKEFSFDIQKCKNRAALATRPNKQIKLDLKKIKKEFKTIIDTPIALVIDIEGEVIVHSYGKLIFKDTNDEDKIKEIAQKIYDAGLI